MWDLVPRPLRHLSFDSSCGSAYFDLFPRVHSRATTLRTRTLCARFAITPVPMAFEYTEETIQLAINACLENSFSVLSGCHEDPNVVPILQYYKAHYITTISEFDQFLSISRVQPCALDRNSSRASTTDCRNYMGQCSQYVRLSPASMWA